MPKIQPSRHLPSFRFQPMLQSLESRLAPATFTVLNLNDSGDGSFRQALIDANQTPGADRIEFSVTGTVTLQSALPAVTDTVEIDAQGPTGPTFGINANGNAGLVFDQGSQASSLVGIALFGAAGDGITLNASNIRIASNYIGLQLAGTLGAPNGGDGIEISPSSTGNLIGNLDPLRGIDYFPSTPAQIQGPIRWHGIQAGPSANQFLMVGSQGEGAQTQGILFQGPITGQNGTSQTVAFPGATTTTARGVSPLDEGVIRIVGSQGDIQNGIAGFYFEGLATELTNTKLYQAVAYPGAVATELVSTMGDFAVGNSRNSLTPQPNLPRNAFLYDLATQSFGGNIAFPGAYETVASGIWQTGSDTYTISGSFSFLGEARPGESHGFLVDFNASTGLFSQWQRFDFPNPDPNQPLDTVFHGLSAVNKGIYTIAAGVIPRDGGAEKGYFLTVKRNDESGFDTESWIPLDGPSGNQPVTSTIADAVYGNAVLGAAFTSNPPATASFQASVNLAFELSNVISGNLGNGININGAANNRVAMNYIGTNLAGSQAIPNGLHGIRIGNAATGNILGGQVSGSNNPTNGVFQRPVQGNLISGNQANGVLIEGGSENNSLYGNFIGTDQTGSGFLGNQLDGVAIVGANNNQLIGCLINQDPFVFYNVLSGNGGNGLRISDSNNTIIHANFLGAGADNATPVGNTLNGLLVEGTSKNTQLGGVIPLGNVIAANKENGAEVKDQASGFVTFNSFFGLFAFSGPAGNGKDGLLITSTGGNQLIRTNVASGNLGNGIRLAGNATGVTIDPNIIGMDTVGKVSMSNGGDGIRVEGNANGNVIGGNLNSIIPHNLTSSNQGYGISFLGTSHGNSVFNTFVGTDIKGQAPFGNVKGGILLGENSFGNLIGSADTSLFNIVSGNFGNGIDINGSRDNVIRSTKIGQGKDSEVIPNTVNGIQITSGANNIIGASSATPNTIVNNAQSGILVQSGSKNTFFFNSISGNTTDGINLAPGANGDIVAPNLTKVVLGANNSLSIEGTVTGAANSLYTVQLFANRPGTTTPQGANYLGQIQVVTDGNGQGTFSFTTPFQRSLGSIFTATVTDDNGNTSEFSNPAIIDGSVVYAASVAQGGAPIINLYNAQTNQLVRSIMAFDPNFNGGVRVAVGDLNGDGFPEIIAGAGPGGGPNVRVFDSLTGQPLPGALGSFMAYSPEFTGGVFVATGDVDGDGNDEILCGAGAGGGPNVRIFSGADATLEESFFAFSPSFTGGISIAAGDLNDDDSDDIICGAGAGGGPHVIAFDAESLDILTSYFAFDPSFTGGVFVSSGGGVNGSAVNVICSMGAGSTPQVALFEGVQTTPFQTFLAYDSGFRGGVRTAVVPSPTLDSFRLMTGPGLGGGPQVKLFDPLSEEVVDSFFAFDPEFLGGLFVG